MQRLYAMKPPTQAYFYSLWSKHRPQIRPKVHGPFMKCTQCVHYQNVLHGTPGVRGTLDETVRERVKAEQHEHLTVSFDAAASCVSRAKTTQVGYMLTPFMNFVEAMVLVLQVRHQWFFFSN